VCLGILFVWRQDKRCLRTAVQTTVDRSAYARRWFIYISFFFKSPDEKFRRETPFAYKRTYKANKFRCNFLWTRAIHRQHAYRVDNVFNTYYVRADHPPIILSTSPPCYTNGGRVMTWQVSNRPHDGKSIRLTTTVVLRVYGVRKTVTWIFNCNTVRTQIVVNKVHVTSPFCKLNNELST